jgi:hypothetical protein
MSDLEFQKDKLDAPCRWCAYNGEGYWQAMTHGEECPWRKVGGALERAAVLEIETMIPDRDAVSDALAKLAQFDRVARYRKIG